MNEAALALNGCHFIPVDRLCKEAQRRRIEIQLYALDEVPPAALRELDDGPCPICAELKAGHEVSHADGWSVVVPHGASWPYELLIAPDEHLADLPVPVVFDHLGGLSADTDENDPDLLGILRAMGTRRRQMLQVFLVQGAVLGLAGSGIGALAGLGLVAAFNTFGPKLFTIPLPPALVPAAMAIATLAGMGAALVPAWRASRLDPVEAIRG